MTPYAHILDAIRTMEERGAEPSFSDFEAMAEILVEEEESKDKEK